MENDFSLIEGILWEPDQGYFLLDEHLNRLVHSAHHFGYEVVPEVIRGQLMSAANEFSGQALKVRLEVSRQGEARVQTEMIVPASPVSYAVFGECVDSSDVFLAHKTSRRDMYEKARRAHPEAEDVILWNERGELTESCQANIVLEIGGEKLTPRADCGLLPGTFRAHLLKRHEIQEAVLAVDEIHRADEVFFINSVRRWRRGVALSQARSTSPLTPTATRSDRMKIERDPRPSGPADKA